MLPGDELGFAKALLLSFFFIFLSLAAASASSPHADLPCYVPVAHQPMKPWCWVKSLQNEADKSPAQQWFYTLRFSSQNILDLYLKGNCDCQGLKLKWSFIFRGRETPSNSKNIPWPSSAKKKDEFCEMFCSHLGSGAADLHHKEVLMEYRECTGQCVVQQEIFYQIQHASAKGEHCKHDLVWASCSSRK